MNRKPYIPLLTAAGLTALCGLSNIAPARAQDDPPPKARAHIIIRGPGGVEERDIEIDPSQLDPSGGNNVVIMKVGPDGQVFSFAGNPAELGLLGGGGGMNFIGPNGMPIPMNGGLEIIDPGRSYIHQLILL